MEITIQKFHFIHSGNENNTLTLKIKPLSLGPNEYLIYRNQPLGLNGKYIKMTKVGRDDATFEATDDHYGQRILIGKTEEVGGFDITPIRTFYRNEHFALVKIVISSGGA
jgi:hypothetical protein